MAPSAWDKVWSNTLGWVQRNRNEEHSETLRYEFSEELEAW